jgi:hypothetical protein
MTPTEKKQTILSRLYPRQDIDYNGVNIEIKPLKFGRVPDCIDVLLELIQNLAEVNFKQDMIAKSMGRLLKMLNECVSIPDCPELTVQDLPLDVIPDVFEVFLNQNLKPGKVQGLMMNVKTVFGLNEGPADQTS